MTTIMQTNTIAAWLLGTLYLLTLSGRLPVDPLAKSILRGLVLYLVVVSQGIALLELVDWYVPARHATSLISMTVFLLVLCAWARRAWEPEAQLGADERELLAWLQPARLWGSR